MDIPLNDINHCGFYPLEDNEIIKYFKKDFVPINMYYPITMVLISRKHKDYKQEILLQNKNQWQYLKYIIVYGDYGALCPIDMLNDFGKDLSNELIINSNKLDDMYKV